MKYIILMIVLIFLLFISCNRYDYLEYARLINIECITECSEKFGIYKFTFKSIDTNETITIIDQWHNGIAFSHNYISYIYCIPVKNNNYLNNFWLTEKYKKKVCCD